MIFCFMVVDIDEYREKCHAKYVLKSFILIFLALDRNYVSNTRDDKVGPDLLREILLHQRALEHEKARTLAGGFNFRTSMAFKLMEVDKFTAGVLFGGNHVMPCIFTSHNCSNLRLVGTRHINSARNHISIANFNNTNIIDLIITAPQNSPNTDGIDISRSSYIRIQNSIIATEDDCIAIKGVTSNINITGVTCGPGHGISVGSLGEKEDYETVEQEYIKNCPFNGAENGKRIKSFPNYEDRNVNFRNKITKKSAVQISGVTYRHVNGTSDSGPAIELTCSPGVGCRIIFMDKINRTSISSGSQVHTSCNNAHGVASSTSPKVPCLSSDLISFHWFSLFGHS
ncbi:hypothetical protein VNO77_35631 [Canavalia gladiata]|uniref:Uncharacterized protein n=1 Tax=Canavalia gladiata TaxID=3824 RepID=A0AAN9K8V6_CANGL